MMMPEKWSAFTTPNIPRNGLFQDKWCFLMQSGGTSRLHLPRHYLSPQLQSGLEELSLSVSLSLILSVLGWGSRSEWSIVSKGSFVFEQCCLIQSPIWFAHCKRERVIDSHGCKPSWMRCIVRHQTENIYICYVFIWYWGVGWICGLRINPLAPR